MMSRILILATCVALLATPTFAATTDPTSDGCLLVEKGQFADAIPLLEARLSAAPEDSRAEFCLGVALSRQGEKTAAVHLKRSLLHNLADPAIHLELGRYFYDRQISAEAEDFFGDAIELSPNGPAAKVAATYLQKLKAVEAGKAWKVILRAGLQYDTNVILNGKDQPLPTGYSGEDDGSAVGTLKILYSPINTKENKFSLGYSLYQSLHFKLDEFDINQNLFEVSAERHFSPLFSARCLYTFEDLQLGGDNYDQSHRISPELQWDTERFGTIIARYSMTSARYQATDRFPNNSDRDGANHQFGLTQFFSVSPTTMIFGSYTRETELDDLDSYSFDGNRLLMGTRVKLPANFIADFSAEHENRIYRATDPVFAEIRRDTKMTLSTTLSTKISARTGLAAGIAYTNNLSNIDSYTYKRYVSSLFFTAEF